MHLWINHRTIVKEDYVLDEEITKQIALQEAKLRSARDVISDIQGKNWELKQERTVVKDVCHKLASYVRQNAIIPFNYSYNEYVEQCITR